MLTGVENPRRIKLWPVRGNAGITVNLAASDGTAALLFGRARVSVVLRGGGTVAARLAGPHDRGTLAAASVL